MHDIYNSDIEYELEKMRYHGRFDKSIDKKFLISYLEKIDKALYSENYNECKHYLYDLYNWVRLAEIKDSSFISKKNMEQIGVFQ